MAEHTNPVNWIDGAWVDGNPPLLSPMDNAT